MSRIIELHSMLGSENFRFASLRGNEGLSQISTFEIEALSAAPNLDLKQLLGTDVTVQIETAGGGSRYFNALVTACGYVGRGSSVESVFRYRATLQSWLSVADKNADFKIFQDKSVPEIVKEVLDAYGFPFEMRLTERYAPRTYVVQYGESDFNFISRLCEDEGIYHYCRHGADRHTVVFTDLSHEPLPEHESILFHSSEQAPDLGTECIFAWHNARALQPGRYATDSYDFKHARGRLDQQNVERKDHSHDNQEIYEWSGAYTQRPHGERLALVRRQQQQLDHHLIRGSSNVRGLAPGYIFRLHEHPCAENNDNYLVVSAHYDFEEERERSGVGNGARWNIEFAVKPAIEQYRAPRHANRPKVVGPQTAVVTGPDGREIWTNEYGQVKVHFHWDRHAPADENSSCWIRVASSWAGGRWGESLIPRIGQEVVVEHIHGDPDQPLITGRVSNSSQMPAAFSNAGSLPAEQALGGIKSREHQGRRYNQLLFDDTTGEIRAQLESEHAKSQLNLGFLCHPRSGGSAKPRGEGFELRTDAWGALRAAMGVLISAEGPSAASGSSLSRDELVACLEAALSLAKGLGDAAAKHDGGASDHGPQASLSKALRDLGHGSNAEPGGNGGSPVVALNAPAGITLTTPASSTVAAGLHLDLVAEHNQQLTAGQGMHLHAGQGIHQFAFGGGIRSIAHQGKQLIQAQHDDIEIAADQSVRITASQNHVMIGADKHVTLTSGGAYIKLSGGNIDIHCPGRLSLKAATHSIEGPTSMGLELPSFGQADAGRRFKLKYGKSGSPAKQQKYRITLDDGQVHEGVTDDKGLTGLAEKDQMRVAHVEFLED